MEDDVGGGPVRAANLMAVEHRPALPAVRAPVAAVHVARHEHQPVVVRRDGGPEHRPAASDADRFDACRREWDGRGRPPGQAAQGGQQERDKEQTQFHFQCAVL